MVNTVFNKNGKQFQYKSLVKIASALQCQVEDIIVSPDTVVNKYADLTFMERLVFDYIKDPNNYPKLLKFVVSEKKLEAEKLLREADENKRKAEDQINKLKKYIK